MKPCVIYVFWLAWVRVCSIYYIGRRQNKIFYIRDAWIHLSRMIFSLHIIYLNWFFRVHHRNTKDVRRHSPTALDSIPWLKEGLPPRIHGCDSKKIYSLAWQNPSTYILIQISDFFRNESKCLQRCQKVVIVIVLICFPHFAKSWPKGLFTLIISVWRIFWQVYC